MAENVTDVRELANTQPERAFAIQVAHLQRQLLLASSRAADTAVHAEDTRNVRRTTPRPPGPTIELVHVGGNPKAAVDHVRVITGGRNPEVFIYSPAAFSAVAERTRQNRAGGAGPEALGSYTRGAGIVESDAPVYQHAQNAFLDLIEARNKEIIATTHGAAKQGAPLPGMAASARGRVTVTLPDGTTVTGSPGNAVPGTGKGR